MLDERTLLETRGVINAALKDAAAVAVSTDSNAVGSDSAENELSILGGKVVETLLDDMVAIQVLDQGDNLVLQGFNDNLDL